MHSIPWAMTWELWRHGRYMLLAALLGANALPMVLFAALSAAGPLQPDEPYMLIMHMVLMQLNMAIFGATVMAAQGKLSRLYTFPVTSATLAAWRLLPAMTLTAGELAASTAFLNMLFGLGWPLWGPAFFLAMTLAAIQATVWLAEDSAWLPWAVAAVILPLGLWFKAQYGPAFSQPQVYWRELTAADGAFMLAVAAVAFVTAALAVGRNRRGEPPLSVGLLAWLGRIFDWVPQQGRPLATPAAAQFWYEWRQKGWVMPTVVAFVMFSGVCLWLIFSRDPADLWQGFLAGGGSLSIAGLLGSLTLGNCGPNDSDTGMGHFLATRPMSTTDMARAILKTAARSVFQAWAIWAAAFLALWMVLLATGLLPRDDFRNHVWWFFPATLLGPWIVSTAGASIGLIGRPHLFVKVLCGMLGSYVGLVLFSEYAMSKAAQVQFSHGVAMALGLAMVGGTSWVYVAARRRSLVERSTMAAAASGWVALSVLLVLAAPRNAAFPLSGYVFLVGLAALAVAPLASTPLAMSWNRTR